MHIKLGKLQTLRRVLHQTSLWSMAEVKGNGSSNQLLPGYLGEYLLLERNGGDINMIQRSKRKTASPLIIITF